MNPKKVLEAKLHSMKKKPEDKKSDTQVEYEPSKYPYGLSINLNKECLENMGLSADSFKAGEEVYIKAKCDVTSVRMEERQKGKAYEEVSLQITDLGICEGEKGGKDES
jgi:hypothetical protein